MGCFCLGIPHLAGRFLAGRLHSFWICVEFLHLLQIGAFINQQKLPLEISWGQTLAEFNVVVAGKGRQQLRLFVFQCTHSETFQL